MAALSNYLEDAILNWFKGTTFPSAPEEVYIGLHTADVTDAGSGTEVSGGSYARAEFDVSDFSSIGDASGAGEISNDEPIVFTVATGNWGTVTHVGVWDAATDGNLLMHGALSDSRTITEGTEFSFPAGDLALRIA